MNQNTDKRNLGSDSDFRFLDGMPPGGQAYGQSSPYTGNTSYYQQGSAPQEPQMDPDTYAQMQAMMAQIMSGMGSQQRSAPQEPYMDPNMYAQMMSGMGNQQRSAPQEPYMDPNMYAQMMSGIGNQQQSAPQEPQIDPNTYAQLQSLLTQMTSGRAHKGIFAHFGLNLILVVCGVFALLYEKAVLERGADYMAWPLVGRAFMVMGFTWLAIAVVRAIIGLRKSKPKYMVVGLLIFFFVVAPWASYQLATKGLDWTPMMVASYIGIGIMVLTLIPVFMQGSQSLPTVVIAAVLGALIIYFAMAVPNQWPLAQWLVTP